MQDQEKVQSEGHSEFRSGTKPLEDPNRIPAQVARATWAGTFDHGSQTAQDDEERTKQQGMWEGEEGGKGAVYLQGQNWKTNECMLGIF